MPAPRLPDRLIPGAAQRGIRPYYGDLHNHCALSYGHGSLETALSQAKRQLDVVSITGHAWWPDMPERTPDNAEGLDYHIEGFARLARLWPGHFRTLADYAEPGRFTVYPGYEMHSRTHGDHTVLLRDIAGQAMVQGDTLDALHANLRQAFGDAAFAFPHHIAYRTGTRGINWDSFREDASPVLELLSMHGSSETSMTDRPFLHTMGPGDGTNTVFWGLNAGHRFGVLGNTDHHSGYPGSYGHGRSAFYATENSPDAIWTALKQRRTNALTGDNTHLFLTLGEAMQGDTVAAGTGGALGIEAIGGSFIDMIDVIRNGAVVQRVTPAITPAPVDGGAGFETILMLELGWGRRDTFHDWTGHIEIDGGTIEAVETRLRGPEVVSPLEGGHDSERADRVTQDGNRVDFRIRAHANPNNATATMQGIALRVRLDQDARILAEFDGQAHAIPADRLIGRALAGSQGTSQNPAWRFHPLPRPEEWQWRGHVDLDPLTPGDWVMLRMRQMNGQSSWTSPIFCR